MHCKRARVEIALWAGNDLDAVSIGRLQRHLATCPCCRDHWRDMKSSLRALHESSDTLVETAGEGARPESVWPAVAVRLAAPDFRGPAGRFNGWVPAIAVAAIFLAMVTLANTARRPATYGEMYGSPYAIPVQNVDWQLFPGPARRAAGIRDFHDEESPSVPRAPLGPPARIEFPTSRTSDGGEWQLQFPQR
ncbi:MAG: hypothetical protein WD069_11345 [Planctomycetales bacterium]